MKQTEHPIPPDIPSFFQQLCTKLKELGIQWMQLNNGNTTIIGISFSEDIS